MASEPPLSYKKKPPTTARQVRSGQRTRTRAEQGEGCQGPTQNPNTDRTQAQTTQAAQQQTASTLTRRWFRTGCEQSAGRWATIFLMGRWRWPHRFRLTALTQLVSVTEPEAHSDVTMSSPQTSTPTTINLAVICSANKGVCEPVSEYEERATRESEKQERDRGRARKQKPENGISSRWYHHNNRTKPTSDGKHCFLGARAGC
jgi:hypothetical protein